MTRSRTDPVKKFARTERSRRDLLLNYFKAKKQFSSSVIESLNVKAKVTMRKADGCGTFRGLARRSRCALPSAQQPEKGTDLLVLQMGLLQGDEVTAPRCRSPAADVHEDLLSHRTVGRRISLGNSR